MQLFLETPELCEPHILPLVRSPSEFQILNPLSFSVPLLLLARLQQEQRALAIYCIAIAYTDFSPTTTPGGLALARILGT